MIEILLIDTAVTTASVCLARNGEKISLRSNESQKDHAAWIHTAIKEDLTEGKSNIQSHSAVALSNGPGSYTGLRVGLSTAKGICYAARIPLITVNTLLLMAMAAKECKN